MKKLQDMLANFVNGALDQVIDHLKAKLDAAIAELDAKYGVIAILKEIADALSDTPAS